MKDEQRSAVTSLIEAYHEAFSAGDINRVLALWDDDGAVFEPGSPDARGREQLRLAYERGYASASYQFECEVESVTIDGGLAVVLSNAEGSVTVKATGAVVPVGARQLFAARRVDGDWKLLRYMFQESPRA